MKLRSIHIESKLSTPITMGNYQPAFWALVGDDKYCNGSSLHS
jgi:hypothetical protein